MPPERTALQYVEVVAGLIGQPTANVLLTPEAGRPTRLGRSVANAPDWRARGPVAPTLF